MSTDAFRAIVETVEDYMAMPAGHKQTISIDALLLIISLRFNELTNQNLQDLIKTMGSFPFCDAIDQVKTLIEGQLAWRELNPIKS